MHESIYGSPAHVELFPRVLLIGISGATRSGKSTLAHKLQSWACAHLHDDEIQVIHQDAFFKLKSAKEKPDALDIDSFVSAIDEAMRSAHAAEGKKIVIVEGFLAFHDEALSSRFDLQVWLDISKNECQKRRFATKPVTEKYFEETIWPAYIEYRDRIRARPRGPNVRFLRIAADEDPAIVFATVLLHLELWPTHLEDVDARSTSYAGSTSEVTKKLLCRLRQRERKLRALNLQLRLAGVPLPALARAHGLDIGASVLPKFMFPNIYDQNGGRESVTLLGAGKATASACSTNKHNQAVTEHYTAVLPEHHLKWRPLLRKTENGVELGNYDFSHSDRLVDWSIAHGLKVKGHVLVWEETSPKKKLKHLESGDFAAAVKDHIFSVMGHFKGRIKEWDVVTGALDEDGTLLKNIFLKKMGPTYIAQCFRWAHEADPDAMLVWSEGRVEYCGSGGALAERAAGFFRLLKSLIDEQVPIHGCGMSMYLRVP
eukprot:g2247.t1